MHKLTMTLSTSPPELTYNLSSSAGALGVKDVQINGTSIVENKVAEIVLGPGLSYNDGEITLSTIDVPEIIPKEITLTQQDNCKLLVIDDGLIKQTTLNNLDYSKLSRTNNLNEVRIGDYLFKTN